MIQTVPTFRRFGSYVLLPLTGAGGMGRVDLAFAAKPVAGQRLCVIKRMHGGLRTPEFVARFRREADIARSLSHRSIAKTLGVEIVEGELCILQEFVHGANVAQLENRAATHEPLPVALSVFIAKEICGALVYAHANSVIHRDVTPDNIMLSYDGEVKLVDFGIAKPVGDQSLTRVGLVVGRPIYTPPDVLRGAQADARADVYSLGVVMWQLLTGRSFPDAPVPGGSLAPSLTNPLVPRAVDAAALRAVAARAEDRFQSAGQLLAALEEVPAVGTADGPALAEFLSRHFDVAGERRQLAADIKTARTVAAQPSAGVPPSASKRGRSLLAAAPGSATRTMFRRLSIGLSMILVALALGGWLFSRRHVAPPTAAGWLKPVPASSTLPSESADGLLEQAALALRFGSLERALSLASRAAHAGAGAQAHLIEGRVLLTRQNFVAAAAAFREAARLAPEDPEPRRYLQLLEREGRNVTTTESVKGRRHE